MRRTTDTQMLLGMGAVAALMAVSAIIGYRNTRQLHNDAYWVAHAYESLYALEDLLSTVKNAESVERGFLLTGDERFLARYENVVALVEEKIEAIQGLAAESERERARIPRLREVIKEKLEELSRTVALQKGEGLEAAREEVLALLDTPKKDTVRAVIAEMRQDEQDLRRERQAANERAYRVSVVTTLITTSLAVGTVVVFLWLLRRHFYDRLQASTTLRDEREWLHVTLRSIGDAVMTTDARGRVTFLNPVAESLTGWGNDEALGESSDCVFHIVNEDTREAVESPITRVLREGGIAGLANHTLLIARDGSERPIDDSASPICDDRGRVAGVVLVFRDVTARRRSEMERQQGDARTRSVIDNIVDGIITIDERGTIQTFNPAAERLFGYRSAETLGQNVKILMPEPYHGEHDGYIANYVRTGVAKIIGIGREVVGRRKDGSTFPMELAVSAFHVGSVRYFTGIVRDITARKQAEVDREYLAAIVDSSFDAVFGNDLSGMVTSWNKGAEYIFGYTAEEMVGQPTTKLAPERRADEMTRIIEQVKKGGPVERFDTIRRKKDGTEILISLTCSPIRDSKGRIVGISKIARDVTERNRLFQALEERSDHLAEADRRKNEFLATLSHELRNPLAALSHALDVLGRTGESPDLVSETRRSMERQLQQIVRLVDDLLEVSRITSGKVQLRRERVELGEVVRHAVEMSRSFVDQGGHDLDIALPAASIHFNADPARLAQVLSNLLNNAAKYTEKGGRIRLTAERLGSEIVLSVKDSGIGIAPEHLPRVFEMFSQAAPALERAQGGLGVGLALARGLVKLHGGSIEARSEGLGKGSEFVVHLPIEVAAPPPRVVARSADAVIPKASKCRILVVDDNHDSAYWLEKLLKLDGHETQIAGDGEEAVRSAEGFRPEVVLMDIGLPRMNGYEAAQHIRGQPWGSKMSLIALTGWGQEDDKRRAREAGFDHHLTKPVDPAVLNRLLATIAASKSSSMAAVGGGALSGLSHPTVSHRPGQASDNV